MVMKVDNRQTIRALSAASDAIAVPFLQKALGHRNADVRHAAAEALQARGDAGFYALLRAAAHGNYQQRLEAVICLGAMRDARALQPLLACLENDRRERKSRSIGRFLLATVVSCLNVEVAVPLWAMTFSASTDLQICVAQALGNLSDLRALLPLIRLARDSHYGVRAAARDALLLLLPHVATLPRDQVRALGANAIPELASLLFDHDEPLVRQALNALAAIGDRQAISAVERLMQIGQRPYLHQEAQRLLAILRERAAQEEQRTILLRGSRPPSLASGADLLRAAIPDHMVGTPPEQLLRSADRRDGDD
jgi:HEAT repeat protein